MSNTAILVIDVQNSFFHRDYWVEEGFQAYKGKQIRLIELARQHGWSVIHVLHNEDEGAFSPKSGYVQSMDFIDRKDSDRVFNKHVHNALTESGLHQWLQEQGISKLVISGIRTEQCCETTTRVGSDMGYEIDFVLDATHTFPMQHPISGKTVSAEAIKSHTALVLNQRFASIRNVADYESAA